MTLKDCKTYIFPPAVKTIIFNTISMFVVYDEINKVKQVSLMYWLFRN